MEVLRVDSENPDEHVMLEAAEAVLRGGVIAFPTDTLYGLFPYVVPSLMVLNWVASRTAGSGKAS